MSGKTREWLEEVLHSSDNRIVVVMPTHVQARHAMREAMNMLPVAELDVTQMRIRRPDGREILFRVARADLSDRLQGLEIDALYEVGS